MAVQRRNILVIASNDVVANNLHRNKEFILVVFLTVNGGTGWSLVRLRCCVCHSGTYAVVTNSRKPLAHMVAKGGSKKRQKFRSIIKHSLLLQLPSSPCPINHVTVLMVVTYLEEWLKVRAAVARHIGRPIRYGGSRVPALLLLLLCRRNCEINAAQQERPIIRTQTHPRDVIVNLAKKIFQFFFRYFSFHASHSLQVHFDVSMM